MTVLPPQIARVPRVNLLSEEPARKLRGGQRPIAIAIAAVLVLAFAGTAYAYLDNEAAERDAEQQLSAAQERLAQVNGRRATPATAQPSPNRRTAPAAPTDPRETTLRATLQGHRDWASLLGSVSAALPSGAWLNELDASKPGVETGGAAERTADKAASGGGSAGASMQVAGCGSSQSAVAGAVDGLAAMRQASSAMLEHSDTSGSSTPAGPAGAPGATGGGSCGDGNAQFAVTVALKAGP